MIPIESRASGEKQVYVHPFTVQGDSDENKSHRKIDGTWFTDDTEISPTLPDSVVSEMCMHAANMPVFKLTHESLKHAASGATEITSKQLIDQLQQRGVADHVAQKMTTDLDNSSMVAVVGLHLNGGGYIGLVDRHDGPPPNTVPYKIRVTQVTSSQQ